jgi:hypothetical protein
MRELLNLSDALRKGIRATSDFLLFDSSIAHALLNLAESANNEERRFRAILKAEEVIASMNAILAKLALGDEQRALIQQSRDALQARLDQATGTASVHLA